MTGAKMIDGKAIAAGVRQQVARDIAAIKASHGVTAGLAVVLVGQDPASQVYVRNKAKQTSEAGMASFEYKLDAGTSEATVLSLVKELNARTDVHGILVQLPLPSQIDSQKVLRTIDPAKDVDGFHPINAGLLSIGERALVPCTPAGCIILAKTVQTSLRGLDAVVVGRSNIVGKPVAQLLLREDCTVTIAHSRTRDLPSVVRRADLVIAAVGRPEMIKGDWIKPGAIVIDVGINRIAGPDGKNLLVGDADTASCAKVASAITPVPGGVGPMTIACLLRNTVEATRAQLGLPAQA
jgi:methylenetetrahydrofolate dehydrogenase (NADP+) / methenyltetrahydrofolate cyclohydrolase